MNKKKFDTTADSNRSDANTLSGNGQCDGPSNAATILLVDDNADVARAVGIACRIAGHQIDLAASPEEALSRLATRKFDAILLDLNFSPGKTDGQEGLALLTRILAADPGARVVVITAHSGVRIAVAAMQTGACDFVMKPWRNAELIAKIEAAIARPSTIAISTQIIPGPNRDAVHILGESPAIENVRAMVCRIGPTEANVAITGPSGAGRSLVGAALHAASLRAGTPLVSVDLEDDKAWGKFADAAGTLVLRHADRLDGIMQGRLLEHLPKAARIFAVVDNTAALTPPLRARIATIEITVPRLADRDGDALILARHFTRMAAERHGRPIPRFTPAAEALLARTTWPDEVRGLALVVERAVLLADNAVIEAAAIMPPVMATASSERTAQYDLADTERALIAAALREHRHNITHAAAALGLTRGALYRRMERHGL